MMGRMPNCPHCDEELTPSQVGALYAALRKTKAGGHKGGRPRITERCPCGKYSVALAAKRNHQCKAKGTK